jgi:hypothetical protein
MKKTVTNICAFIALLCCSLDTQAAETFSFQFDNSAIPEVDFIGQEAGDLFFGFGDDLLNAGERFEVNFGSTLGAGDLANQIYGPFQVDVAGFGAGNTLGIIPQTDTFFATVSVLEGSFVLTDINILFSTGNEFGIFKGEKIRNISAVPEPATWLMMIIGFAGVGLSLRSRQKTQASHI